MESGSGLLPGFRQFRECISLPGGGNAVRLCSAVSGSAADPYELELMFVRVCNELYASGFSVETVTLSLILPETAQEPFLRGMTACFLSLCGREGIVPGQVSARCEAYVASAAASLFAVGISGKEEFMTEKKKNPPCLADSSLNDRGGMREEKNAETVHGPEDPAGSAEENAAGPNHAGKRQVLPGEELYAIGSTGCSGTWLLEQKKRGELSEHYAGSFLDGAASLRNHMSLKGLRQLVRMVPSTVYPVGEGGVFAALWYFAEGERFGFCADLKAIPVRQETVEICEFFRINPYMLAGDGMALAVSGRGEAFAREAAALGLTCRRIGMVTAEKARILRNEDEVRFLDRPAPDALYQVLGRQ